MERTKHGEFNWVDLSAHDLEVQSAFYEALFGWAHTDIQVVEGMTYRLFKGDGHTVSGISQLPPEMLEQGMRTGWNTCVTVGDVDAAVERAVELGGQVVVPAMDIPEQGRQALIQDPEGAHLFFWKSFHPDESTEYSRPGRLAWNELNTRDPERAISFYSALLGAEIDQIMTDPSPYWQIKVDGQAQAGISPMPQMVPPEVPAYWLVYFGSADAKDTVSRALQLGATQLVPPTEVPGMLVFAVLADPAGASFGILQALMDPSKEEGGTK